MSIRRKEKEKEKKRNIDNDLAVWLSYDTSSLPTPPSMLTIA